MVGKRSLFIGCSVAALVSASGAFAQERKEEKAPAAPQHAAPGPAPHAQPSPAAQPPRQEQRAPRQVEQQPARQNQRAQPREEHPSAQPTAHKAQEKQPATSKAAAAPSVPKRAAQERDERAVKEQTPDLKSQAQQHSTAPAPKGADAAKAADATKSGGNTRLSENDRTRVHDEILRTPKVNRVARNKFEPRQGARVPRSVHVALLPAAIFALVPQYRGYDYVVVDDDVCIIDPRTYEIVEVLGASESGPRTIVAKLQLSAGDIAFLQQNIPLSGGPTLGLGALNEAEPLPPNVEVLEFPKSVVDQIPSLSGYLYFTADRRIVIVDPSDKHIALVLPPMQ
jgi:uncharacterized protein DUF1236